MMLGWGNRRSAEFRELDRAPSRAAEALENRLLLTAVPSASITESFGSYFGIPSQCPRARWLAKY